MSAAEPRSFLVIKTSSIGDVVLTTPVAEALRNAYPESHIAWLVEDKVADVLLGNPFVDDVIVWARKSLREVRRKRQWGAVRAEVAALSARLGARRYDCCLDLQGFDRTLLPHALIKADRRILLPGRDRLSGYTKSIWKRIPREHAVDYHLNVLRSGGLRIGSVVPRMRLPFSPDDARQARELLAPLAEYRKIVAINPSTTWPAKVWEWSRYADVARRLIEELAVGVVIVGGNTEGPACANLANEIGPGAISLAGITSLKQLAATLTLCDCLLSSDSGPMHISVAVGTPVVAMFGPTHPANHGPRGPEHTVIYRELACSPCMNRALVNPSCMDGITADFVFEQVARKLCPSLISVEALEGRDSARSAVNG
ncbi:MAG: glycosyltransferase family 9 protein [Chloroflexi bacterium]|nr:glycosyltransferase family 9 protein [Chloroflexota bacterium]